MSNRKTWKSVGALLLTVAMLAGMLSVMGALPTTAKTTSAMKFTADFSDLTALVNENRRHLHGRYVPCALHAQKRYHVA